MTPVPAAQAKNTKNATAETHSKSASAQKKEPRYFAALSVYYLITLLILPALVLFCVTELVLLSA